MIRERAMYCFDLMNHSYAWPKIFTFFLEYVIDTRTSFHAMSPLDSEVTKPLQGPWTVMEADPLLWYPSVAKIW